jgi:hypothetical protein
VEFRVNGWNRSAVEAAAAWRGKDRRGADWDWETVFQEFRAPDRLEVTIWGAEGQLCGIALCTLSDKFILIRFMEATPLAGNPLKGKISLVIMDVAARYAQLMGRTEMRLQPLNEGVAAYYLGLGFRLVSVRKQTPYYVREI